MCVVSMSWRYHTSFDPYNKEEFMDWTWTDLVLDWTNGKTVTGLQCLTTDLRLKSHTFGSNK